MIWATGGGAINIIFERTGGVYFCLGRRLNPDVAVAILWTATGLGLTLGMLIAHRTSIYLDRNNWNRGFVGWTLVIHGLLFSVGAYADAAAFCHRDLCLASDSRCRIRGAGNDVPAEPARSYSRTNFDT